jgi:hypothetical protein
MASHPFGDCQRGQQHDPAARQCPAKPPEMVVLNGRSAEDQPHHAGREQQRAPDIEPSVRGPRAAWDDAVYPEDQQGGHRQVEPEDRPPARQARKHAADQ